MSVQKVTGLVSGKAWSEIWIYLMPKPKVLTSTQCLQTEVPYLTVAWVVRPEQPTPA